MIYFTSDQHFLHKNIIKYCDRPFEFSQDGLIKCAETIYKNDKYSYLIKVNENEDDFINEFQVVKSSFTGFDEYMETIDDNELLKEVIPLLLPEAKELMKDKDKLKEYLN